MFEYDKQSYFLFIHYLNLNLNTSSYNKARSHSSCAAIEYRSCIIFFKIIPFSDVSQLLQIEGGVVEWQQTC